MVKSLAQAYFSLMRYTELDGECWVRKKNRGRAFVNADGKRYLASRLVMFFHHGLDIDNPYVLACHHCDNPRCYNPKHLYVGSPADNVKDREERFYGKVH